MNCPNCGRELAEGEVCNCMTNEVFPNAAPIAEPTVTAPPVAEAPAEAPAFTTPQPPVQPEAPAYTAPQQPQGAYVPPVYGAAPNAYQSPTYGDPNAAYQQPYYAPVAEVPARTDYPEGYKIKRKYVAVLLGLWLGAFGIHNFYLGNQSKAIAQLLLSTVGSLLFFIGPVAASVWAMVETVQILTESIDKDANGFKIQTFEEALVKTRMEAERKAKEEENK